MKIFDGVKYITLDRLRKGVRGRRYSGCGECRRYTRGDATRRRGTSAMDLTRWLEGLDLEQYLRAFRESDVDAAVLPELTADDLTALGVTSIGHRRKLLAAIAALLCDPPRSRRWRQPLLARRHSRAPTVVVGAERR